MACQLCYPGTIDIGEAEHAGERIEFQYELFFKCGELIEKYERKRI
jgi:hypothetical protein